MDNTRAQARENGYVETVFGRRLYLPDIRSGNAQLRQYAERSAINAPMQGTAADIIKRAMIAIDAWCRARGLPARLIMQVHDELVFEVPGAGVAELTAAVRECMVNAASLSVPLRVDVGRGAQLGDCAPGTGCRGGARPGRFLRCPLARGRRKPGTPRYRGRTGPATHFHRHRSGACSAP